MRLLKRTQPEKGMAKELHNGVFWIEDTNVFWIEDKNVETVQINLVYSHKIEGGV